MPPKGQTKRVSNWHLKRRLQESVIMTNLITPNPDDVFATCQLKAEGESSYLIRENALVYVARGSLDVLIDSAKITSVGENECVFVRKDHRMTLVHHPDENIGYHLSVFLFFPRQLLFEYYKTLREADLPEKVERSKQSYLKIPKSSLLISLFESFRPYWATGESPEKHWLRIKVLEAIRLLLKQDRSIYASLFDFTSRWRLDILDFMNKNYKYDLTIEDIANYTGRSLATFKRDFSKLSDISPRNWIIERRLKAARHLLYTTDWQIYKVMKESGFKNFSHFSRCYREHFGETPTEARKKM